MSSNRYWYNNGKFEEVISSPILISRILLRSDLGLHVSWRTSGTRIPFYKEQYKLLQVLLNLNNIRNTTASMEEFLLQEIGSLLRRNRIFKGALIDLFFFPEEKTSTDSPSGIFIFSQVYQEEKFILNKRGLNLGWLKDSYHPGTEIMCGLMNSCQRVSIFDNLLQKHKIDTGYLTNKNQNIVDGIDSNLFVIKANKMYTPSLNTGTYPRALRRIIITNAQKLGIQSIETDQLSPTHLDKADELFLVNDIYGIKWIVAHNENRYFRKYAELFVNLINKEWEGVH
jgi:branched-chain amino acid aminotransferase